jgi:hypothetical protein
MAVGLEWDTSGGLCLVKIHGWMICGDHFGHTSCPDWVSGMGLYGNCLTYWKILCYRSYHSLNGAPDWVTWIAWRWKNAVSGSPTFQH